MSTLFPVNSSTLTLNAYSNRALPVQYRIIYGDDHVNLTQSGDTWYLQPVSEGEVAIVAYQEGTATIKAATPIVKVIYITSVPNDTSRVVASIVNQTLDPSNVQVSILTLPELPEGLGLLLPIPLEPGEVSVERIGPIAPSLVTLSTKPNECSNVDVTLNVQPTFVRAKLPNEPFDVSNVNAEVISVFPPTLKYVLNLTEYTKQAILTESIVATDGMADFWGSSTAQNYLKVEGDKFGVLVNPEWKFDTRNYVDQTDWLYINDNYPAANGRYAEPSDTDGNDKYKIYWKQYYNSDGEIPSEPDTHYMFFVSCKYDHIFISRKDIFVNTADERETAINLIKDRFYNYNANWSTSGYNDWKNWVDINYGNWVVKRDVAYSGTVGLFVVHDDFRTYRYATVKSLQILDDSFNDYQNSKSFEMHSSESLSLAKRSIPVDIQAFYKSTAGDILGGMKALPSNQFPHHPTVPTPFRERFVNSTTGYYGNPYAVVGDGIVLDNGRRSNQPANPSGVTTTIMG